MAATVEWIGGGKDQIAAALLSSLCRDHDRTLEDIEAAYCKFSNNNQQISTLSPDLHSIAQLTLTTVYDGIEATSTRLHSPPLGPWAALLVLVFMLHDLCDLDCAPPEIALRCVGSTAAAIERFGPSKLDYSHALLIETIRLILSTYGSPAEPTHPDMQLVI